ncbi:unnamed protein product [Ectocarpus sp. 12 AP-2014]
MTKYHEQNIEQIERAFYIIDANFSTLYLKSENEASRRSLTAARDAARDTFWAAVAKELEDNHDLVQQTRGELTAASDQLEQMIEETESFAKTIDQIAQVVKLASSLATIASI